MDARRALKRMSTKTDVLPPTVDILHPLTYRYLCNHPWNKNGEYTAPINVLRRLRGYRPHPRIQSSRNPAVDHSILGETARLFDALPLVSSDPDAGAAARAAAALAPRGHGRHDACKHAKGRHRMGNVPGHVVIAIT